MRGARRWLPLLALTAAAAAFAVLNRGEATSIRLGVTTVHQVPVTAVVFLAFLAGMLTMFGFGVRQDLRIRRMLREHGLLDSPRRTPSAREHERTAGLYEHENAD